MLYPSSRKIRPCPGDPRDYTMVKRGNKYHWRLKRGTLKPATLNAALRYRNDVMRETSPFVKRLKRQLLPHLDYLDVFDLHQRLYGRAEQQYAETRHFNYNKFLGFEMQPAHPLDHVLLCHYTVATTNGFVELKILPSQHPVRAQNRDVTEYVFETILVIGTGENMCTHEQSSPIFDIHEPLLHCLQMDISVPATKPWMLILKLSCFEGREWARSGRHYGMRVVAVGGGESGVHSP